MRLLGRLLLNFLEVIFIGPFGIYMRSRNRTPEQPPPDLMQQLMRAKQMDEEDERKRKAREGNE